MKRRIFVAIKLSEESQQQIAAWQRKYDLPVRWISEKNLHITLIPPWYEEDLDHVQASLRRVAKHSAFTITLHTVEYGPAKRPRVIWAVGETTKDMLQLQEHVESALGAHHEKQFKLHVTIARFNPERFSEFPKKRINEKVLWTERISSIVLMESLLSKDGAEYEVIEEVKFS